MNVELEHGTRDQRTNVTNDDPLMIGKMAWAHLVEFPDYYGRLEKEAARHSGKKKTEMPCLPFRANTWRT